MCASKEANNWLSFTVWFLFQFFFLMMQNKRRCVCTWSKRTNKKTYTIFLDGDISYQSQQKLIVFFLLVLLAWRITAAAAAAVNIEWTIIDRNKTAATAVAKKKLEILFKKKNLFINLDYIDKQWPERKNAKRSTQRALFVCVFVCRSSSNFVSQTKTKTKVKKKKEFFFSIKSATIAEIDQMKYCMFIWWSIRKFWWEIDARWEKRNKKCY